MREIRVLMHCRVCRHPLNPRSELCERGCPHCTVEGCVPDGYRLGVEPNPLGGTRGERAQPLAATAVVPNRLVDLASYQQGINLAVVKAAGFSAVNVKLSQGNWYTWSGGRAMADAAESLGMGICTFSWIDNSATGAEQAAYAYGQMQRIGGPAGMAHQCDCEDTARPATWAIWRDYVSWWQDKLGRHVANYTGDWWWQPRGWNGSGLTPYLWAAPNAGYLSNYPGDASSAWHAGYGGWDIYSLLQYAVSPILNAGGGNLSKTAIRDPAVWAALTAGGTMAAFDEPDPNFGSGMENAYSAHHMLLDLMALKVQPGGTYWQGKLYPVDPTFINTIIEMRDTLRRLGDGTVDVDELADRITAGLIASNTNGLTPADHEAVRADVLDVAQQLLQRAAGTAA